MGRDEREKEGDGEGDGCGPYSFSSWIRQLTRIPNSYNKSDQRCGSNCNKTPLVE